MLGMSSSLWRPILMHSKALKVLESLRPLCPFLRSHTILTESLISGSASRCPFMRSMHLSHPGQPMSFEELAKRLNDPATFLDLDEIAGPQPTEIDYEGRFETAIQTLKDENRYRVFVNILRYCGEFPRAVRIGEQSGKKDVVVWCSNDYLGMGQNRKVLDAMIGAVEKHGAASGGTRNIGGTTDFHVDLERELADLHDKEAALICTSGYVANEAALSTLPKIFPQGTIFFSDSENHASMIEGMRHAKVAKGDIRVFRHNDVKHLGEMLRQAHASDADAKKAKILVFESVYSMSGSIAPLEKLKALAEQYNCLTYIDEVHGVGLYGHRGGGVTQEYGVEMDIVSGTLGKAFGVHGGYIAGSAAMVDCIRSYASGFIFTTSIPHVVAAGALAAVRHLKTSQIERNLQRKHVAYMKSQLVAADLPLMPSDSHIIPLFIGHPGKCKEVSDILLTEFGIYVQPINYPTVPKGEERLRLAPGPLHTNELIDEFIAAAKTVWKRLDLVTYTKMHEQANSGK